ncbi:MAG: class II aldolase/adducin family protein [Acidiferrobacterales bacterium]|nr:class II aldolase/adducin family protein [Acidiferrobacterales bacterium]
MAIAAQTKSSTQVPANCSPAEWAVRVDLAACYRAFVHFGWTDLLFTHLSARVPGEDQHYLVNPYGLLFQEITASNLIKVDFEGNVVTGDYPFNDAGHAIHTAVLKARPDIHIALHSHTRAGMAVSCMSEGLLPLTQQANEVRSLVCYHDYDVATNNEAECDRLGNDLADKWLMIMRNHGLLAVGRTVGEAFYYLYTLENACKVQVDVMQSGSTPVIPSESSIKRLELEGLPPAGGPSTTTVMAWDAVRRLLDRKDNSYQS